MHLSVYDFIYQVTPRVFSVVGTLQQQGLSSCTWSYIMVLCLDQTSLGRSERRDQAAVYTGPYIDQADVYIGPCIDQADVYVGPCMDQAAVYIGPCIDQADMYIKAMHTPSCCVH